MKAFRELLRQRRVAERREACLVRQRGRDCPGERAVRVVFGDRVADGRGAGGVAAGRSLTLGALSLPKGVPRRAVGLAADVQLGAPPGTRRARG